MNDELAGQIHGLSDADAIAALTLVLDLEEGTAQDLAELQADQARLPEAFATTPDLGEVAAPESGATNGDLARAALVYLAEDEATSQLVSQAVGRPRRPGQRDPLTFAVGGLILLALKSDVQLKRTASGRWSFSYRLKPTKDSALGSILAKLWGLYGGGHG